MTDLIDTVQKTSLDDAFLELFDVELKYKDSNGVTQTETLHLTDGLEEGELNLWLPFETSSGTVWAEYLACPMQIEGISVDNTGAASRPTLSIANIASLARGMSNYDNTVTPSTSDGSENEVNIDAILKGLNISKNEDVLGSIVTYRKTLLKNTFIRANDSGTPRWYPQDHPTRTGTGTGIYDVNSAPTAVEFASQKFVLDRVAGENNLIVQFELANPLDVQGLQVPNRYVIGKYCPWEYKGAVAGSVKSGCPWRSTGYTTRGDFAQGTTYNTNDIVVDGGQRYYVIGDPTNAGAEGSVAADNTAHPGTWGLGPWFDIDNNPTTQANDVCGKTIQSCKCRFHPKTSASGNPVYQNTDRGLPFGGFPGSRKFK